MSNKIIRMMPPGYDDFVYPETTASAVIQETDLKFMTEAEKTKLSGIAEGANNYSHPTSGVTAGTYKSVVVDEEGHIISGSNPTSLSGYGITDAMKNTIERAGGTATEITLACASVLNDGLFITFIVSADNEGYDTTINTKPLYILGSEASPSLYAGKAVSAWYDQSGDCFFFKASAEGNVVAEFVLAGFTFSNDSGTNLVGIMSDLSGVALDARSIYDNTTSHLVVRMPTMGTNQPLYAVNANTEVKIPYQMISDQLSISASDIRLNKTFLGMTGTLEGKIDIAGSGSLSSLPMENIVKGDLVVAKSSGSKLFRATDRINFPNNPDILPPGSSGNSVVFSPDGVYLITATSVNGGLCLYQNQSGIFTQIVTTDFSALLSSPQQIAFSPNGTYLAVGTNSSPYITIYKRSGATFTKLSNPTTLPTSSVGALAFSPDNTYLAVGFGASPYIFIYKRSGDTFTKLSGPTLPGYAGDIVFSPDGIHLAVGHYGSPYISIYKRSGDSFSKLSNPASLPPGTVAATAFSPNGAYLATGSSFSPYIAIYKRNGDVYTKLSNPSSPPTTTINAIAFSPDGANLFIGATTCKFYSVDTGTDTFTSIAMPYGISYVNGVAISPDSNYYALACNGTYNDNIVITYRSGGVLNSLLKYMDSSPGIYLSCMSMTQNADYFAAAGSSSPYIALYKISSGFFTKLANPATLPAGTVYSVAFSPDGIYLAVGHATSPYVTIYKRAGDVFTKLGGPGTLPTGAANSVEFSPDGIYLAVGHATSPYVTIYKRAGDVFTKLGDLGTLPSGTGTVVTFSPDGTYFVVGGGGSPYFLIYKREGDVFTKLANPATLPMGVVYAATFSPDGTYLAIGHYNSPYVSVYKREGDVFTKLANPTVLPAYTIKSVAFSPDGVFLIVVSEYRVMSCYKRENDVFIQTNPSFMSGALNKTKAMFTQNLNSGETSLVVLASGEMQIYVYNTTTPGLFKYTSVSDFNAVEYAGFGIAEEPGSTDSAGPIKITTLPMK